MGTKFFLSYQPTSKWRINHISQLSPERFETRQHLAGGRQFNSLSATYFTYPHQYWLAGVNYFGHQAQGADDSFRNRGFFVGWGQEWTKGISSSLTLSTHQRQHKGGIFSTSNVKMKAIRQTCRCGNATGIG